MTKIAVSIREPRLENEANFIVLMSASNSLHSPWLTAPQISEQFRTYIAKYTQQERNKSFLVISSIDKQRILGYKNS